MSTSNAGKIPYMAQKPNLPPPYWVTTRGRNVIACATACCGGIYFTGYTALHTLFLDRYKNVVQLYKHGFRTPLTSETADRCQRVVSDLNLKMKAPDIIEFFCAFGMDMFHAGSINMRTGSIVGVPRHFSYGSPAHVEKNDIMVENKPIEWGSDGGQLLKDSLVVSERAQKFAIAREIVMTDTHSPYIHGGLGGFALFTYYCITRTVNDKFYGLARPKSFRVFVYSLVGTFTFGIWATMTDVITKRYEKWADERVGSIGLDYAKGGVELYAKTLERNIALRSLMGPNGEKRFTFYGNDVEFIRQRHIPYTERKRAMEALAEKLAKINERVEDQMTMS
ncbi:unnamed protein product [Orchesella dallaii]|uniref:Transmembrane protein 177 n=1 Tax=Orchesella dallaii TaxID=48710 RepID=A0ABP1QAJ9_9HEXA